MTNKPFYRGFPFFPEDKQRMDTKISSGTEVFDTFLQGGYDRDVITTIYGPGGVGKTCLCTLCSIAVINRGKKVIYIDTEGGFSLARLQQLTPHYATVLNHILFLKPSHFEEQKRIIEKLRTIATESIGLIVVDTIGMLYRLEFTKDEAVFDLNRELGKQLVCLADIARKRNIPVLVANQVYSAVAEANGVRMVGGDILLYGSKCLIELQKEQKNLRKAILKKHRSLPEQEMCFHIVQEGIERAIRQG